MRIKVEEYTPRSKGMIERQVHWLHQERDRIGDAGILAITLIFTAISCMSIIGIPFYRRARKIHNLLEIKAQFYQIAQNRSSPNEELQTPLKTKTTTCNHVKQFVIHDGIIWHRRHNETRWQPLFFEGFPEGKEPVMIDCDGANLIALDEDNLVYYKKILKEFHDGQDLRILDKTEKHNWKEKWFMLPYLHHASFLFMKKRLALPKDARSVAISHRGNYNGYLEDAHGRKHPSGGGCTTLYVLDSQGRDIRKYDPWSPLFADISIPLPESESKTFEALTMSASASTLMVIGYESRKDACEKTLKIYTRLSDIDTEGWNPMFKYDYWLSADDPNLHILPIESEWTKHPLPENGDVAKTISIHQTGIGNEARQLRIAGRQNGVPGFFWKSLREKFWHFHESNEILIQEALPRSLPADPEDFQTTIHSYTGSGRIETRWVHEASLTGFGERSYHSNLIIGEHQWELHRRKGLKNFLGLKGDFYELFVPGSTSFIKAPRTVPVQVVSKENSVAISCANPFIDLTFSLLQSQNKTDILLS